MPKAFASGTIKPERVPGRTPLVVLLVTPAHIGLLENGKDFISLLLDRSFRNPVSGHECDVITGVVDRIPLPNISKNDGRPVPKVEQFKSMCRQRLEDGFEGIAVGILDSGAAAPDLWNVRPMSTHRETMTIQQRCFISFSFPSYFSKARLSDTVADTPQRVLQLPVANTLFQNGKTSTLIAQKWKTIRGEGSIAYDCVKETTLPQQTIHMAMPLRTRGLILDTLLKTYLTPITPPRKVIASIGNIIRKLSIGGESDSSEPASANLEQVIRKRMDHCLTPQRIEVWALVRPRGLPTLPDEYGHDHADILQREVFRGSRLHKVLSGGGGWGEKQGLLALDPDPDYDSVVKQNPQIDTDISSMRPEKDTVFEDLVRPGDSVTFYMNDLAPLSEPPLEVDAGAPDADMVECLDISVPQPSFAFGCLPSTMDALQSVELPSLRRDVPRPHMMIRNYFGMLSEQGMSLQTIFRDFSPPKVDDAVASADVSDLESCNQPSVKTKLDIPHLLFSIRPRIRVRDASDTEDDVENPAALSKKYPLGMYQPGSSSPTKVGSETESFQRERETDLEDLQARFETSKAASKFWMAERRRLEAQIANNLQRPRFRKIGQPEKTYTQRINASTPLSVRQSGTQSVLVRRHLARIDDIHQFTLASTVSQRKTTIAQNASTEKAKTQRNAETESNDGEQPSRPNLVHKIKGRQALPGTPIGGLVVKKYNLGDNSPRDAAKRDLLPIRKHTSFNPNSPFNVAQELHEQGQISARSQAANLHHQYHLPLRQEEDA